MRRQIVFNTPIGREVTEANTVSCVERHDTMLSVVDGQLVSRRRPGLPPFADLGTGAPVVGLFYWREKNIILAVSDKTLYKVSSAGTVTSLGAITGPNRAIFAEFTTPSNEVAIATGDKIYYTDGLTVQAVSDSDAPTSVSFIRHFQKYAIANETGTDRIHYNDALSFDIADWAGELFSAEGAPDDVVAVGIGFDQLYLFGNRTVERYWNDGVTPFQKAQGGIIEYGCIAPYSVLFVDNSFFYLNHERQVIKLTGSQPQVVSLPVDADIRSFSKVSDAFAMHDIERQLYILCFPTADRTLVYDYVQNGWVGDWSYWDQDLAEYERWRGNCMEYVSEWNKTIVGDKSNGKLYYMDESNYQDNGSLMRDSHISHNFVPNQFDWVSCNRLDILLKRGHGTSDPVFKLRYRDNGSQTWSNVKDGSIGNIGDNDYRVTFRRLGRYRSRQYEFYCTDDAPFTLLAAFEEIE